MNHPIYDITNHSSCLSNNPGVNIQYFIMPQKKTFLSVAELAMEIPYSQKSIYNMISNGFFIEDKHYKKINGKVVFYFPAVAALFTPEASVLDAESSQNSTTDKNLNQEIYLTKKNEKQSIKKTKDIVSNNNVWKVE